MSPRQRPLGLAPWRLGLVFGVLLLIVLGSAPVAAEGSSGGRPTGRPPGIHVEGNRIVDSRGKQVTLHGVDMSGTEYACAQNYTSDPFGGQPEDSPQTLASMRSWHVNAVRIPLNEDCWLGINGVRIGGAAYRSAITKLVADLEASGFYVILDLHWSAPGSVRALSQNPAPDEDHSPAFWASVASTFKDQDQVIFDLFNEPYFRWLAPGSPGQWTCLWKGCSFTRYLTGGDPGTESGQWRSAGMEQLIQVVRGEGAENVLLVAGVDWANDLSGWLEGKPKDQNLAASWHSYPRNQCSTESCWEKTVAPLARHVPVVMTETGDSTSAPATYMPKLLPWCDRHGISYLAWTWNAWSKKTNVLVTNMETGAPTPGEGAYYRRHLLQLWREQQRR